MLWCSLPEISLCIGLIMIILYGLFSLSMSSPSFLPTKAFSSSSLSGFAKQTQGEKVGGSLNRSASLNMVNLFLGDVYFFSRLWPVMLLLGYAIDFNLTSIAGAAAQGLPLAAASVAAAEQGSAAALISLHAVHEGVESNFNLLSNVAFSSAIAYPGNNGIDILLIILTVVIMQSFKSFESVLLLLLAFVGQLFMLHSCDLVSFYICLEVQNFCFLVLCGLQPRVLKYNVPVASSSSILREAALKVNTNKASGSRPLAGVEASIKYLLLSAFSSGVLLFWFSVLYLRTGITTLSWGPLTSTPFSVAEYNSALTSHLGGVESSAASGGMPFESSVAGHGPALASHLALQEGVDSFIDVMPQMLILLALMFKLGGAPLHLWMIDIYSGVKRQLLMYIATAPKLSLFGFWVSTWHSVWTDFTVLMFVAFSMIIGCFGAYSQPTLRSLFAYSTVNEIGLMLMAIETAGFHSLFQHLTIYIVTMLLLWNNSDKRLFAVLAISLAGLPPLAGFFGKAWIFNSVAVGSLAGPYIGILIISLFCTGLSLVYYLRVFRLFAMNSLTSYKNVIFPAGVDSNAGVSHSMGIETRTYGSSALNLNIKLTSFCVIFLIFAPLFYIKPFVL